MICPTLQEKLISINLGRNLKSVVTLNFNQLTIILMELEKIMIVLTRSRQKKNKVSTNLKMKKSSFPSLKENYLITRKKAIKKLRSYKDKNKKLSYAFGRQKLKKKFYYT